MQTPTDGHVVILSADDADTIARQLLQLSTTLWDLLATRRVTLRPPTPAAPAKIVPLRRCPSRAAQLDELF